MGATAADPRASLAALAAREPEQPGLIWFDEDQARWRWRSWRWLEEAVREEERGERTAGGEPSSGEPMSGETTSGETMSGETMSGEAIHPPGGAAATWPSVERLVAALAVAAGGETAGAPSPAPSISAGSARPIVLLAEAPEAGEPRAWLALALAAGAALVLPAGPELLGWSVAWTRPSHLALPAAELPRLREELLLLESARALRRRLRRLRHLHVWGEAPYAGEAAAWAELGVPVTRWAAG